MRRCGCCAPAASSRSTTRWPVAACPTRSRDEETLDRVASCRAGTPTNGWRRCSSRRRRPAGRGQAAKTGRRPGQRGQRGRLCQAQRRKPGRLLRLGLRATASRDGCRSPGALGALPVVGGGPRRASDVEMGPGPLPVTHAGTARRRRTRSGRSPGTDWRGPLRGNPGRHGVVSERHPPEPLPLLFRSSATPRPVHRWSRTGRRWSCPARPWTAPVSVARSTTRSGSSTSSA